MKEKTTLEEILLRQENVFGFPITDYIRPDGYVWKSVIKAMEEYAELARNEERGRVRETKEWIDNFSGRYISYMGETYLHREDLQGLIDSIFHSLKLDKEGEGNE